MNNEPKDLKASLSSSYSPVILKWSLLLVGILFVVAPSLPTMASALRVEPISTIALTTIEESLSRNIKVFATLSSVKASLGVIEGSQVGLSLGASFQLELGDLVQPAYDYVDITWNFFLSGLLLLLLYKLILASGILVVGLPLIGIGIFVKGIAMFGSNPHMTRREALTRSDSSSSRLANRFIVSGALIAYILPVIAITGHTLSEHFLEPMKQTSLATFTNAAAKMKESSGKIFEVKDTFSILHPGEGLSNIRAAIEQLATSIGTLAQEALLSLMGYLLLLSLELLIIPAALVWIALPGLRMLISRS